MAKEISATFTCTQIWVGGNNVQVGGRWIEKKGDKRSDVFLPFKGAIASVEIYTVERGTDEKETGLPEELCTLITRAQMIPSPSPSTATIEILPLITDNEDVDDNVDDEVYLLPPFAKLTKVEDGAPPSPIATSMTTATTTTSAMETPLILTSKIDAVGAIAR